MKDAKEMEKFCRAYEELGATSVLLVRAEDGGKAEVWETADRLLTVVDFDKMEFLTKKREDDPEKYDMARADFLAAAGGGPK